MSISTMTILRDTVFLRLLGSTGQCECICSDLRPDTIGEPPRFGVPFVRLSRRLDEIRRAAAANNKAPKTQPIAMTATSSLVRELLLLAV
jgi:hypothetical protein